MARDIITDILGPIDTSAYAPVEQALQIDRSTNIGSSRGMSYEQKIELLSMLKAKEEYTDYSGHLTKFFAEGDHKGYPKHLHFFEEGRDNRERIFLAANRVGKTIAGAYEMSCHLTGMYPEWWTGRRFIDPIDAWAAGDTGQTTRDIIQLELLGSIGDLGTGMVAKDLILDRRMRPGIPDAIDTARIRHTSGGVSTLGFKSFDQKRRSFQGTAKHVIWLDEEPPIEVYGECVIRTMTTNGMVYVTFTPLQGLTKFVTDFMRGASQGDSVYEMARDKEEKFTPQVRD